MPGEVVAATSPSSRGSQPSRLVLVVDDEEGLRDLLCHRTGLRRADLLAYGAGFNPQVVMRRLKYLQPIADPRTKLIYNNHMYTVLGEVIARMLKAA